MWKKCPEAMTQSQQLLHLVLKKRYNTNAPYPAETEYFSSQSGEHMQKANGPITHLCNQVNTNAQSTTAT